MTRPRQTPQRLTRKQRLEEEKLCLQNLALKNTLKHVLPSAKLKAHHDEECLRIEAETDDIIREQLRFEALTEQADERVSLREVKEAYQQTQQDEYQGNGGVNDPFGISKADQDYLAAKARRREDRLLFHRQSSKTADELTADSAS